MENKMTHGALFSGSGGFELAARNFGIETLWASEIEPLPMLVTMKNFPQIEHLGDIRRIDGTKLPYVDVVSGGSPCQNMSVAGKREGLSGSQSVLFMEYIRIVKEMKESGKCPRYMVWENVPGALSSNGGEDFRCVIEEICKIKDPSYAVPMPGKSKWTGAGSVMGKGFSLAWRMFDAQYWGVPQRRRRIYLVADFRGASAPEILFERKGVSWHPPKGRKKEEEPSEAAEGCADGAGWAYGIENHPNDSRVGIIRDGKCQTLTSRMGTGGGQCSISSGE